MLYHVIELDGGRFENGAFHVGVMVVGRTC